MLALIIAVAVGRASVPTTSAAQAPTSSPTLTPTYTYTPAPTPAPARTTFTPPAGSPPTVYTGRGDDVVAITKDPGPAILKFECLRCSRNTIVKSDGHDSLLVNEIGNYSGRRLIDIQDGSSTSTITVKATGSWKITVSSGLSAARVGTSGAPIAGRGDDVLIVNGTSTKARVTNKGQSNFIVHVVPIQTASINLAVNTIGGYEGTVPLQGPAIVMVRSSGNWSLTAS
jgi:hypothetical protein